MSLGLRQRTRCATCAASVRVAPLEIMLRGGHGWRGHWRWWSVRLCPPCQASLCQQLGGQWIQLELELQEQHELGRDEETYQPRRPRSRPWRTNTGRVSRQLQELVDTKEGGSTSLTSGGDFSNME